MSPRDSINAMTNETRPPRLAVLIDADNASSKIADGLFEEIAKLGEASVRRIYGDFSSDRLKGWRDILAHHAIIPQLQLAYTTGKNSADITLVIDAMDLLHSGRFDGFCLVSSDSDFTRLASRIREQGIDVYGFGEKKTPESFRQACRRFIYTENLTPETPGNDGGGATSVRPLKSADDAAKLLKSAIASIEDSGDGWASLSALGTQLANLSSDFDPRNYGYKKLSDMIRGTPGFEISEGTGRHLQVRLLQKTNKTTSSARKKT